MNICDQTESVSNVTLSVSETTGELVISSPKKNATLTESIRINLKSLIEKDENGTAITDAKHSFTNFNQFNFTVTPFTNGTTNNVSRWSSFLTINNVSETTNNFTVEVSTSIFSEEGEIYTGDKELAQVGPGYVKFSFNVKDWVFCSNSTPCEGDQIGSFLDLAFEVQDSENATKGHDLKYKIGNSDLVFSNYYNIDEANSTKLPSGYPQYQKLQDSDVFTVRFPTFKTNALYDPIVVMEGVELSHSNTWMIVGIIVAILAIAIVVFAVVKCFKTGRKEEALMP
jgi:hypothetical protein